MKTVEIIISPNGNSIVETKGFSGSECQSVSKFLEEALGQKINERLTSEFYQTEPARVENRQQH